MAQFKRTVPNEEVRLRKWPGGRVNQLRTVLSHMRTAIDGSLAAQVQQTGSRKFSEFLPKIVKQDITTEINYREIRLIFSPPRGLRKFLFYEMDVSRVPNFNKFDRFNSPETVFTFTALEPGVTYYFRLRMVSTEGEVGPWSETIVVTALRARASSVFDNRTLTGFIEKTSLSWKDLVVVDHPAIGGVLFYMINFQARPTLQFTPEFNLLWSDVELRWLENDVQVGNFFNLTSYSVNSFRSSLPPNLGNTIEGNISKGLSFLLPGPFNTERSGTFSQKLHQVNEGTITIKLQGRIKNTHPSALSWLPNLDPTKTVASLGMGSQFQFRNFSSFEYIVDS